MQLGETLFMMPFTMRTFNPFWDATIEDFVKKNCFILNFQSLLGCNWIKKNEERRADIFAFNPFWDATKYGIRLNISLDQAFNPFWDATMW